LPGWAERCREWSHVEGKCEYVKMGRVPVGEGNGEKVLCGCGMGKLPEGFIALPGWEAAARYATRVAISPVFAEGLVEELVDEELFEAAVVEARGETCSLRNCKRKVGRGMRGEQCVQAQE
jgi:hypothetical protein